MRRTPDENSDSLPNPGESHAVWTSDERCQRRPLDASLRLGKTAGGSKCAPESVEFRNGGERGIRTPDTRKGIHAFEARAFSHSAISPHPSFVFILSGKLLASTFLAHLSELSPAQPPHPSPRIRFVTRFTTVATSGSEIWVSMSRVLRMSLCRSWAGSSAGCASFSPAWRSSGFCP
jgi:hypothetical protein